MPYCPRCGVEADPSVRSCPLCATNLPVFDDLGPGEPAWPRASGGPADPSRRFSGPAEVRLRTFLVILGVLATGAIAVTASDLFTAGALTWARYPLVCLAGALGLLVTAWAFPRQPGMGAWVAILVIVLFLVALDATDDGQVDWSVALGLPISLATALLVTAAILLGRLGRRRGYNLFALGSVAIAAELFVIDALVALWTTGQASLGWSLVTALALGPLAFLFTVLHLALGHTTDLRRTFHL